MSDWSYRHIDRACRDTGCSLPLGFFRLRYFHGKTMRLADYVDEQRYHAGKMRFHSERLHGAGILCGLKVSLLDQTGPSLRVARGAALDDCGREIIVGGDQCIDVGAWFRRQRRLPHDSGHDPCKPDEHQRVRVCVMLRYAECAGSPEPAPTASCGTAAADDCSAGRARGCPDPCTESAEYGRIGETFELKLMFSDQARHLAEHTLFPAAERIDAAVARAFGGVGLLAGLSAAIRAGCPSSHEQWLMLACFDLVIDVDDPEKVVALVDIDHACATQVLLSTEVLQYLVAGLVADGDVNIGGPSIRAVDFRRLAEARYQFVLALSAEIDGASLDVDSPFGLRQLTHGWKAPDSNAVTMKYKPRRDLPDDIDGPAIYIDVDNADGFLRHGGRYQLYTAANAPPVVDAWLRPLRPRQFLWRFGLERSDDTGALTMVELAPRSMRHG